MTWAIDRVLGAALIKQPNAYIKCVSHIKSSSNNQMHTSNACQMSNHHQTTKCMHQMRVKCQILIKQPNACIKCKHQMHVKHQMQTSNINIKYQHRNGLNSRNQQRITGKELTAITSPHHRNFKSFSSRFSKFFNCLKKQIFHLLASLSAIDCRSFHSLLSITKRYAEQTPRLLRESINDGNPFIVREVNEN